MIPLALVLAARGRGPALRAAIAPPRRPTLVHASALVAAAILSFVLGALVGAGLAHATSAPSSEHSMAGRRYGSEGAGSALGVQHPYVVPGAPIPGRSRLDRRAAAARDRREARRAEHVQAIAARERAAEKAAAAALDISSWLDGGDI